MLYQKSGNIYIFWNTRRTVCVPWDAEEIPPQRTSVFMMLASLVASTCINRRNIIWAHALFIRVKFGFSGLLKSPLECILVENDRPCTRLTGDPVYGTMKCNLFSSVGFSNVAKTFYCCVNHISGFVVSTADLLGKNRGLDVVFKHISPHSTKHLRSIKWVSHVVRVRHWRMLILPESKNGSVCWKCWSLHYSHACLH